MAKKCNAHTLVEVIVIVLILGALAFIAVPRLQYSTLYRKKADTVAKRIVTDLRRTRRLAITNAATNTDGFALNRTSSTFEIEDLSDSSTVANSTFTVESNINCSGGTSFQFGPLGNLKTGSDSQLIVSSNGRSFTINIIPATGIVQCTQN
jgi:Tfp pilus assembly protein FimT